MDVFYRSVAGLAVLMVLAAMTACAPTGPPTGTYTINTFEFVPSSPPASAGEPKDSEPNPTEIAPGIWIDTNTKLSSLSGGTLTSSLPCSVMIDYTDSTFKLKSAVVTSVKVTYDDDTVDSAAAALKLPLRFTAQEVESVNSVSGGKIVRNKDLVITGKIPQVITRAAPFRLQLEGHFLKADGSQLPFTIDQHFDIKREEAVKSAAEVLQDK